VKKNDSQLQQDVIAELKWEPSVNAAQIGVEVKDGIVTLSGHIQSYAEKWGAETAAQRVAGVKALAVELKVSLPGASKRSDSDIAKAANDALQWLTYLSKNPISVMVENGWVTLSGSVDWDYQRDAAAGAVRYLVGVTGVSDDIEITAKASLTTVKADIEAALKRSAVADSRKISVKVDGTDVTLSGTVSSWSEREVATHSAWAAPGVRNVVDKMTMTY
jgi:osmotically-inducible protein OsmY